jgi:ABC-type glycerol-3-phosphate transport system substrate-binding protein
MEIIWSEAQAYFAGDKTAEQAADNIQSRVSLYLAEQG